MKRHTATIGNLHVVGQEDKCCMWEKSWVHFHVNMLCVGGQGLCVVEAVSYVSLSLAYVSAILLVWCAVKITIIYFLKSTELDISEGEVRVRSRRLHRDIFWESGFLSL